MNKRIRSQTATTTNFLKPGALALLRDSKVIAKSHRLLLLPQLSSTSLPPPSIQIADADSLDNLARFSSPIYGPRRFGRKKLLAAKSSVFILGFTPPTPVVVDSQDSTVRVVPALNNNLLVH